MTDDPDAAAAAYARAQEAIAKAKAEGATELRLNGGTYGNGFDLLRDIPVV